MFHIQGEQILIGPTQILKSEITEKKGGGRIYQRSNARVVITFYTQAWRLGGLENVNPPGF